MEWRVALLVHAGEILRVLIVHQGLANQSYSHPLRRGPQLSLVPNQENGGSGRLSDFPKVTQPKGNGPKVKPLKMLFLAAGDRSSCSLRA